jgi:succinate dehydrogenase / fumarate reductase cytochrome b subunit
MKNSYYSRKLHSLLGIVPLGAFLLEHMLTNYEAFNSGKEGYIDMVLWINELPLVFFIELFGIWLPLLYHGVYGLYVAFQSRNNVPNYGYFRNWMFFLQRLSGVVTIIFVSWHVFETRVQVALGKYEHAEVGALMHEILSNPGMFAFYVVGVIFASFHFCNGIWSFLVSWGITVGPRAQRVSTYVTMALFVIMSVMFVLALTAFTNSEFALAGDIVRAII